MWNKILKQPLKTKLWLMAATALVCASVLLLTLFGSISDSLRDFEKVNRVNRQLSGAAELLGDMGQITDAMMRLDLYRKNGDFENAYSKLKQQLDAIDMYYIDHVTYYQFQDVLNMVESYREKTEMAVQELKQGEIEKAGLNYSKMLNIKRLIQSEIEGLIINLYNGNAATRDGIAGQLMLMSVTAPLLIAILALMIGSMVLYFDHRLVQPISQLTETARAISKGRYYETKLKLEPDNEFNLLSDTMYSMSNKIRENIAELRNKAEITEQLHKKEIENLRIKSQYDNLELRRLQEQINPHFLFNMLSTLQHMAFLEEAEGTCEMANSIAKVLRYSLKESNTIVTLREEWDNLLQYVNIQQKRFGERISVELSAPTPLPGISLPVLTIQPLVENCYNHGLENMRAGGRIAVWVEEKEACIWINVWDNGRGMDAQEMEEYKKLFSRRQSAGEGYRKIGMLNVVRRLQKLYHTKKVIELIPRDGLLIRLILPDKKEGENDFNPDRG